MVDKHDRLQDHQNAVRKLSRSDTNLILRNQPPLRLALRILYLHCQEIQDLGTFFHLLLLFGLSPIPGCNRHHQDDHWLTGNGGTTQVIVIISFFCVQTLNPSPKLPKFQLEVFSDWKSDSILSELFLVATWFWGKKKQTRFLCM